MHFLSKLRRKALITPALCSRYLIITKSYQIKRTPSPPLFLFDTRRTCFLVRRANGTACQYMGNELPRAEAATPHRMAASGSEGSERTSSQSPWRLTSPLNLCKKRKHRSPRSISTSQPTRVTMRTRGPTVSFIFTVTPMYVCNSN